MKIAKGFSYLFSVLGTVLMVGTILLCLLNLNSEVKMDTIPPEAGASAEAFLNALSSGDYAAAQQLMYGQPSLGLESGTGDAMTEKVWEAFRGSITYQLSEKTYADGTDIYRDAIVTTLDVAAVMEAVPALAKDYVEAQAAQAEDPEAAYSQQALDAAMQQALTQALKNGRTVSYEVSLQLVQKDGRWWVIPDAALLRAISGGVK